MNPIIHRNANGELHCDGGLPAVEDVDIGAKEWWVNGQRHRDEDLPAVEYDNGDGDGDKYWYVNGELHREGGLPAIQCTDGEKWWYVNGKRHRDGDLPAIEYADGDKYWYVNGKLHREGGLPAIEYTNGYKDWWVNGCNFSKEKGIVYFSFCQKMAEKKRIRAQKKIYFWWIQICYDLDHHSGCGKRMAQKNLEVFETMMKV